MECRLDLGPDPDQVALHRAVRIDQDRALAQVSEPESQRIAQQRVAYFRFVISANACRFRGTYQTDGGSGGAWSGRLLVPRC
jgi:hypothetical protein